MAAIIRASHPISFHLVNPEGYSILGIFDSNKGQTSTLEIINSSRRDLKLKKLDGAEATATNHHFELKFRPGTLNLSTTNPITVDAGTAGWRISKPTETPDGVSFYLLSTNPPELASGNRTAVKLNGLNGDGSGGAHGTRVELKWREGGLEYKAANSQQAEPLTAGQRVQYLTIVNQRGEKDIPLHVWFDGTNQVLNDGSDNTLKLRLTSQLKEGNIDLIPENDPGYARSTFILSFDASVQEQWTIGTPSKVNSFKVKAVGGGTEFNVREPKEGETPEWILWPKQRGVLRPGSSLDVTISNITTQRQPGPVNLYIKYKNIPGYWDGEFVAVVEKTPLFLSPDHAAVGIGTNKPQATLDVNGLLRVKNGLSLDQNCDFSVDSSAKGGRFTVTPAGQVGVGTNDPKTKLHVVGDMRLDQGEIFIKDGGQIRTYDDTHRILFRRSENKLEFREAGDIIFSSGSTDGNEKSKAVLLANGNFGVGTKTPKKTLTVNGGVRIENEVSVGGSGAFEVDAPYVLGGRFKITSDGTVGVGLGVENSTTVNPKLQVNGNVQVAKTKEIFFEDNGQIRSYDDNHRILFRREENKMEFREFGNIIFSPGCKDGKQTAKIVFLENGRLGVGTTAPTAPLEVADSVATAIRGQFWFTHVTFSSHTPLNAAHDTSVSIKTSGAMLSQSAFYVFSDARIKTDFKSSAPAADLDILSRLRVTDFRYIDVVTRGSQYKKGLIAQQVEEVFPQAVSQHVGVIPDVYQPAKHVDGWVELANDLKPGERVRLISEHNEGVHEVLEATPDRFRTDFKSDSERVFVFGREVKDLRILDHDAIAVLNVSATQQLKKELDQEVNSLRAENVALRAANDALARRLELLETKLEAVLSVVGAANGANGNGHRPV